MSGGLGLTRLSVRVGVGLSPFDADGMEPARFWELIDTLERVGYDSLWLRDTAQIGGLAPLPALAAVAARTTRLKLGTSVLVLPPRNPVLLARELATVDVLSGGRLLAAGGLGINTPAEREAMGVLGEERVDRLEESLKIIKALWAGAPVNMSGRFWSLTDATLTPRPVRPKLEFWLGGLAPAALRRVGRIADGWLASLVAPGDFGAKVEVIRAAATASGRWIDEDHYGAVIYSSPSTREIPAAAGAFFAGQPGAGLADQAGCGVGETQDLLERFVAQGATKFVLIPLAADPVAWLGELYPQVIAPLEAAGAFRSPRPA